MDLKFTVDAIFTQLHELGRPIARRRRPGIDPGIVGTELRSLGLDSPADLVRLYSICDGTDTETGEPIDEILLFPGFYWLSFHEAIETYNSLRTTQDWRRTWLPIFANGGGDFYAVICDTASMDYGGVVGFVVGEEGQIVEFKTVTCMFETIRKSFAQDAFYLSDGYLEADYSKMRLLAQSVQPDFLEHAA